MGSWRKNDRQKEGRPEQQFPRGGGGETEAVAWLGTDEGYRLGAHLPCKPSCFFSPQPALATTPGKHAHAHAPTGEDYRNRRETIAIATGSSLAGHCRYRGSRSAWLQRHASVAAAAVACVCQVRESKAATAGHRSQCPVGDEFRGSAGGMRAAEQRASEECETARFALDGGEVRSRLETLNGSYPGSGRGGS